MPERVHEPAPVAAPTVQSAVAPAPVAGFGPAQVLALQRSAGNAATTRYLRRQAAGAAAPPAGPVGADALEGKIEPPAARNNAKLTARPQKVGGLDAVIVESDIVDLKGQVTAKETDPANPGQAIEPEVRVGFVQTVEQVGRIGKYTDDGTPTGKPYAEVRPYLKPGTRDVQGQRSAAGAPATDKATPPFYDAYQTLNHRGQTRELESMDRLSQPFETELHGGKGKLASIAGTDRFRTSVAAHQPPGAPIHLDAAEWSQDWSMVIDPATHTGTGAVPSAHAFKGQLAALGFPTGAANRDQITWTAAKDPAALAQLSHGELLRALPLAREQDGAVYEAMAKRLRDENPKLRFKLECTDDGALFSDVAVTFRVTGVRGPATRQAKLGSGPTATSTAEFAFGILDFFDPNDVTFKMALSVEVESQGAAAATAGVTDLGARGKAFELKSGSATYKVTPLGF